MIKVIIADDEPLVQAGVKSMINWESYDMTIAGIASNGSIAYDMICEHEPEIVITDIKMPVMSGLELAKKCFEEKRQLPVFLILTSYEEFQFVKEALKYQVSDYLVKLELTPESLTDALKRATEKVYAIRESMHVQETAISSISILREQFFMRLILNLFKSEHQMLSQASNLHISLDYGLFLVGYLEISREAGDGMHSEKQLTLYTSSLQMVRELISKYLSCYVLSLDTKHFCIIFFLNNAENYKTEISNALSKVSSMLHNYYNVTLLASVGPPVEDPVQITTSYNDARRFSHNVTPQAPLLFFEDGKNDPFLGHVFNFSLFRGELQKAFTECDEDALFHIINTISELFVSNNASYVQLLDAAGNILYLSLSFLSNGEQIVSEIFKNYPNNYRSLYELNTTRQILDWLYVLRDGVCSALASQKKNYKNHTVNQVKSFINEHIKEKLSLNEVAETFNISPSYLSSLFSKYNDVGFNDYINQQKIETAKNLLANSDMKIYEISDFLGFENAFYFSRVFKKITGVSPREYLNRPE